MAALYRTTASDIVPPRSQTVILHISGIHSNPLGLEVARQLAASFRVDAVLDTGDLTSFGLPVEARATGQPYEAELLRFSGSELVAVDYVSLAGIDGSFTITREFVRNA